MNLRLAKFYAIISFDDLPKVDFAQVEETSETTIRQSIDLTQFVIKWNVEPTFIEDGTITPIQILGYNEALELMQTDKWTIDIDE